MTIRRVLKMAARLIGIDEEDDEIILYACTAISFAQNTDNQHTPAAKFFHNIFTSDGVYGHAYFEDDELSDDELLTRRGIALDLAVLIAEDERV